MESGGLINVKGKVNKVAAYYPLFAKQRTSVDIAEHFNGVPIPFLGREAEIKAIVSEFKSRRSKSDNSLINIHGPDAIGKSRLIHRTIDRLYAGQTDILYLETGHASRQFLANFIYPLKTLVQSRYQSVETSSKFFKRITSPTHGPVIQFLSTFSFDS